MNYQLIKDVLELVEEFEVSTDSSPHADIESFKQWLVKNTHYNSVDADPNWEGKVNGRSKESIISTLIVHMNRFGKNYSKAAILGSEFTSQEDFIYLINLRAFGKMTKMELIKKNVHEKPIGILIINRLMLKGWIIQEKNDSDKRSKIISITNEGIEALENQMIKIRQATNIVSGDLSEKEKTELIRLLSKLNDFHLPIYEKNIDSSQLLEVGLSSSLKK
ncbi:MarR family transcriptional regulator [Sphingobacterium sp. DK4209]|uniref:MarR family transcriptional regulator n=1 Tax=Sphingobacterium zhuxiongii TaxID=2662364 RepID=A0A5Q0QHM1_9SPHI|nr:MULTISPECIES: MarR family winged helix-turn-helix transcriptional regulator [unclassified Sphingobacterium]MVZ67343.1 MarR family transcriptional regulator [Sphingobacterium sp. DK4209]QGA26930.1 MarR family transcriptional regulator [Sphingobacterium sp. dk4302]